MKYELKRMAMFPVVKVTFIVSLVLGFLLGILYAMFFGSILAMASRAGGLQGMELPQMGFGALLVIMPVMISILSAVFNTILAVLAVAIYNFVTKFAGGLEFELQAMDSTTAPMQPHPMDVPGAYYAQTSMTPRYAPPPPPYQPAPPPPVPPTPPAPPTDPQADKNSPTRFPFE